MHLDRPAVLVDGDQPVWRTQVVVIENPDMGQFPQCLAQMCHDARGSGFQLFGPNIVPALRDPHRHTLFGHIGAGDSDKTKDNLKPIQSRFLEKCQLVSDGIGKDGLEDEALSLPAEFASQGFRQIRGLIRIDAQLARQDIRIDKAQSGRL